MTGHGNLNGELLADFLARTASETGLLHWPLIALAAFLLAAVTDFADGVLARLLDAQTAFGAWLDPIADKLLVGLVLIALSITSGSYAIIIPSALILIRDVYITRLRGQLGGGLALPVMRIAKWKTASEMLAIAFLLMAPALDAGRLGQVPDMAGVAGVVAGASSLPFYAAGLVFLWISAVLSVWTGLTYRHAAQTALDEQTKSTFD